MEINHHSNDVPSNAQSHKSSHSNSDSVLTSHSAPSFNDTFEVVENSKTNIQTTPLILDEFHFSLQSSTLKAAQFVYAFSEFIRKHKKDASFNPKLLANEFSSSLGSLSFFLDLQLFDRRSEETLPFTTSFSNIFISKLIHFFESCIDHSPTGCSLSIDFSFLHLPLSITIKPLSEDSNQSYEILLETNDSDLFSELSTHKTTLLLSLKESLPHLQFSFNIQLI